MHTYIHMDVYAYTYRAELLHLQGPSHPPPQASVAHSRQPRPYSSLGFQVKFLRTFPGVPSPLGSDCRLYWLREAVSKGAYMQGS